MTDFSGVYANEIYPIVKKELFGGDSVGKYFGSVMMSHGIKANSRVLEIACGDGTDLHELQRQGYVVEGLDLSSELLEIAAKNMEGVRFYNLPAEGNWNSMNGRFSAVCCMMSFVEFDKPRDVCNNVARKTEEGGIFVFDFGNVTGWKLGSEDWEEDLGVWHRKVSRTVRSDGVRVSLYEYSKRRGKEEPIVVALEAYLHGIFDIAGFLWPWFTIESSFSDLSFDPAKWNDDKYVTIVARRNKVPAR